MASHSDIIGPTGVGFQDNISSERKTMSTAKTLILLPLLTLASLDLSFAAEDLLPA